MLTSKEHIINRKIIIMRAGFTQTAFAQKAGVSRIVLYRALTGETKKSRCTRGSATPWAFRRKYSGRNSTAKITVIINKFKEAFMQSFPFSDCKLNTFKDSRKRKENSHFISVISKLKFQTEFLNQNSKPKLGLQGA